MGIKHIKNNNIADWSDGELQHQISNGNFPNGTTLNDIVLPSDWNDEHEITSDLDLGEFGISGGNAAFKSLNINGTHGNGHIHLKHQATDPSSTSSSSTLFADNDGNISWLNDGLDKITLDTNGATGARNYTFQDKNYTLAGLDDLAPYLLSSTAASTYAPLTRTISTTTPLQGGGDLSTNRTLSILQAGTSQSGFLSSTDWNTFNGKQNALPNFTSGQILFGDGDNVPSTDSSLFWDNVNKRLGINTPVPLFGFHITTSGTNTARFANVAGGNLSIYTDSTYAGVFNGASLVADDAYYMGANGHFWITDGAESMRIFGKQLGVNGSPLGQFHVRSESLSTITSIFQGAASQSANLAEWQNSSGTKLSSVSAKGVLKFDAPTTSFSDTSANTITNSSVFGFQFRAGSGAAYNFTMFDSVGYLIFGLDSTNTNFIIGKDTALLSGKKFFLDGVSDTYLWEKSSNNIAIVTGSIERLSVSSVVKSSVAIEFPIRTVANNTNLLDNDYTVLVDATSGNITITLPTTVGASGRIYNIKKVDPSINTVTIATTSSQTIDGAATSVILTQYEKKSIQSDGANWYIL